MKGEYVETKNENPNNMFSKLHHPLPQQHQHQHQHQHIQHHNPFANPFHQIQNTDCQQQQPQTSEDDESRSSGGGPILTPQAQSQAQKPKHDGDGATIEVVRRPRGRPPGSKNKPKPPVIITREPEPAMSPYILEVPGGNDVVEAISRFCRRRNTGLCVLTASGTVANVTLRQPSTTPGATVTFHGRFDILSISATFLPNATTTSFPPIPNSFTISLAGPQGQIVGGIVAGSLIAAGTVYVVAASFNNPSYHRLPPELDDIVRNSGEEHSPPATVSGGGGESGQHAPGESCGMSMYSCHLPSDVIWAPTPRQPPPPPPPY
ncbi:AT-hook motif nuclear-localized protein 17-like [Fagus crenata]